MKQHLVTLGLATILFCSCAPKSEKEKEVTAKTRMNEITGLPNIILMSADGRQFSTNKLPGKTLLIFFSADCDHCQREATQIHENLKAFESYSIYFISLDPFPVIRKFSETYKIDNNPNIFFVRADGQSVFSAMGYMKTPTICIYSANKKLVKRFDGETKIEEILKLL